MDRYSFRVAIVSLSLIIILLATTIVFLSILQRQIPVMVGTVTTAAITGLGFLMVQPPRQE